MGHWEMLEGHEKPKFLPGSPQWKPVYVLDNLLSTISVFVDDRGINSYKNPRLQATHQCDPCGEKGKDKIPRRDI